MGSEQSASKDNDKSSQQVSTDENEKQNNSPTNNNNGTNNIIDNDNIQQSTIEENKIIVIEPPKKKMNVLTEESAKYQHYLKFLYKNNFVSLTYDDLCAFMVQYHWRRFFIEKLRKKRRGMIDIIYSTLEYNPNVSTHQSQAFLILDNKKYPYRCYDLMTYKNLSKTVEKLGGAQSLPLIFINGYYIGSYDQFQELEDTKMIGRIINREYQESCLMCHVLRSNEELDTCPYCYKKYLFFALDTNTYDIYNNRFISQ